MVIVVRGIFFSILILLFFSSFPASTSAQLVDVAPNGFKDISTGKLWLDVYLFSDLTYKQTRLSLIGTGYRLATKAEVEAVLAAGLSVAGANISRLHSFGDKVSGPVVPTLCCRSIVGWYDDTSTGVDDSAGGTGGVVYVYTGDRLSTYTNDDDYPEQHKSRVIGAWVVQDDTAPSDLGPLTRDFDADGLPEKIVWRENTGTWYIRLSSDSNTMLTYQWGLPGDRPIVGDFDGDKRPDMAVWRPSNGTWYVLSSLVAFKYGDPIVKQFGLPGDVPLQQDFDGDQELDFAVWRPSNGSYYYLKADQTVVVEQWGLPGDVPVAGAPSK